MIVFVFAYYSFYENFLYKCLYSLLLSFIWTSLVITLLNVKIKLRFHVHKYGVRVFSLWFDRRSIFRRKLSMYSTHKTVPWGKLWYIRVLAFTWWIAYSNYITMLLVFRAQFLILQTCVVVGTGRGKASPLEHVFSVGCTARGESDAIQLLILLLFSHACARRTRANQQEAHGEWASCRASLTSGWSSSARCCCTRNSSAPWIASSCSSSCAASRSTPPRTASDFTL